MKNARFVGLYVLMAVAVGPVWSADTKTETQIIPWDTAALNEVPKIHPTRECAVPGMRSFFYEGADYKGNPTRVFAYYAAPDGKPPAGGWPAVVCAHGGGGTAFPEWVKKWNEHGYAAISMDLEGHLPDGRSHENAGPARQNWFSDIGLPDRAKWDPSAHLPHAKMPMLWINGSNDGTFPMDIFQRSALSAAGPSTLHVRFRWLHGHEPGRKRPEIYAFADSIVKGRKPLPTASRPERDPKTGRVWTKTTGEIRRAALCYTMHGGKWQRRYWENAACEFGENEVSSRLPKGATVFYFNVRDEDLNLVSSVYVEVKPE